MAETKKTVAVEGRAILFVEAVAMQLGIRVIDLAGAIEEAGYILSDGKES